MTTKWAERRTGQKARGRRRGEVFPIRMTAAERLALIALRDQTAGPEALGPWLIWAAQQAAIARVLPPRVGDTRSSAAAGQYPAGEVLPHQVRQYPSGQSSGNTGARVILDLCGGSGAWSEPYARAGYRVHVVTLPALDVRTFEPPEGVHGILAAPPCTEFSIAKNGQKRELPRALEEVTHCMRIIAMAKPKWWALENPVGLLGRWLGTPADVWEPYEFGDPWTKRTAIWGSFELPTRGPFVTPTASAMDRPTAAARAVTPPGFARAFFEANP